MGLSEEFPQLCIVFQTVALGLPGLELMQGAYTERGGHSQRVVMAEVCRVPAGPRRTHRAAAQHSHLVPP